jgi:Histidine kinase-, DNA gyrase B-, and HSP90-like ATPase
MELELGLDVIRSYKRMAYEPWTALGEFVDNSTQSYFNNQEALDRAYAAEGERLTVGIVYEKDGAGLLRITDNAMGMSRDELDRAMHVGLPPLFAEGRSRYGLGMKQAACWFGNKWKIVTKKLGETTEYSVFLDVEKAAEGDGDLHEVEVGELSPDLHYTRIEITDLNQRPQTRTQSKIKQFLSGMYRLDIQSGLLILKWQNSPLEAEDDWTFVKNSLGDELRKNFHMKVDGKDAWGWVGVLDVGGRSKAGFAIAHNNRMVRVWPTAWRPEELFGTAEGSNDLVNQRLVGIIHLDQFDVSHTKDAIHWVGDEEDQVQAKLKEICADYREMARQTKKGRNHQEAAIQVAARVLEQELKSAELVDLIDAQQPEPTIIAQDETILLEETDTTSADFKASFMHAGIPVSVVGKLDSTKSPNDPYVLCEATQDDRVVVVINMNHPQVGSIEENGLLNYFRYCTYDALAEWRARRQGTIEPSTIRKLKDQFLRVQFDIDIS